MVATVGSMSVMGKFSAGGVLSGFKNIIGNMKQTGMESKNLNTEMGRMTGSMTAMAAAAGLTGGALLAMLVRAVMTSPLLAGSLAKLKIAFMLFGNTIAKHVKPIIEWVIKAVKWLHAKFKALPEPIQGAIVKFIVIGGVIISFLSILAVLLISLAVLVVSLGKLKAALITIGGAKVLAALAAPAAALFPLAVIIGTVGLLIVLLRSKLPEFFSNLGEGFREASGPAAAFRDMIIIMIGWFGALGLAAVDLARGDFGLPRAKAAIEEMREAKRRLKERDYGRESSSSINLPSSVTETNTKTETNITNIDFNGATFEVPEGEGSLKDLLQQIEELKAQDLQTRQV